MLKLKAEGDRPIQSNESTGRLRIICFVVSFLLHGILVYWLVTSKYTIDMDPFGFEVKTVIITPMERMFYPGTWDESLAPGVRATEEGGDPVIGDPLLTVPSGSIGGLRMDERGHFPEPSKDFSSSFRLLLPRDYMSNLPEDFDLSLESEISFPRFDYSQKEKAKNISGIPGLFVSGFSDTTRKLSANIPVRRRRSGPPAGKPVSQSVRQFDIKLWAGNVVDRIQKNWEINTAEIKELKDPVSVSVVVERSGRVRAIEIINPSDDEILDLSALRAIRMSYPLPQLPPEFPEDELEILLVFKING